MNNENQNNMEKQTNSVNNTLIDSVKEDPKVEVNIKKSNKNFLLIIIIILICLLGVALYYFLVAYEENNEEEAKTPTTEVEKELTNEEIITKTIENVNNNLNSYEIEVNLETSSNDNITKTSYLIKNDTENDIVFTDIVQNTNGVEITTDIYWQYRVDDMLSYTRYHGATNYTTAMEPKADILTFDLAEMVDLLTRDEMEITRIEDNMTFKGKFPEEVALVFLQGNIDNNEIFDIEISVENDYIKSFSLKLDSELYGYIYYEIIFNSVNEELNLVLPTNVE